MARRLEDQEGSSIGVKIEDGVFSKVFTVKGIDDISSYPGKEQKTFNSGKPTQLAMWVTLEDEAQRESKLLLMGWFKKEEKTGKITDWDPWLNKFNRFLSIVCPDVEYIEDDLSVAPNTFLNYIGKQVQCVVYYAKKDYTNDKNEHVTSGWSRWGFVFKADEDPEVIKRLWAENKTYINDLNLTEYLNKQDEKKYADKENASFNYGANANDGPVKEDIL